MNFFYIDSNQVWLYNYNCFRQIFENRDANALRQQGIDDPDTIVTFSIKYYYTRQFAEVTDDIELYMDQECTFE